MNDARQEIDGLLTKYAMAIDLNLDRVGARQALLSAIDALLARNEWQPIETAPKDRKLIAGYPNALGKWRTVTACYYSAGTLQQDYDSEDEYAPEGWYEESDSHETLLRTSEEPTHWMPLPAPPRSEP